MEQIKQIQKYYDNSYLFNHLTNILNISIIQDPKQGQQQFIRLLLKENIFHPQGGGQPDDEGKIKLNEEQFLIHSLFNHRQENQVYLNFPFSEELFEKFTIAKDQNQQIEQQIDENKRRKYAQLHSAGHFLDMVVKKIGLNWLPSKAYHFVDGPYVEYNGDLGGKGEEIQNQIQQYSDQLIKQIPLDDKRITENLTLEQLKLKLGEVPPYLKDAEQVRYIQLCNIDTGCPCGGTHVNHVNEIGRIIVTKIQKKGKSIRMNYRIENY